MPGRHASAAFPLTSSILLCAALSGWLHVTSDTFFTVGPSLLFDRVDPSFTWSTLSPLSAYITVHVHTIPSLLHSFVNVLLPVQSYTVDHKNVRNFYF